MAPLQPDAQPSSEGEAPPQLRMIWPHHLRNSPPALCVSHEYVLRTFREGEQDRFFELMHLAGWPGWDAARLRPWVARLLPDGWFVAVHHASDTIVATAMALRDCSEFGSEGGELGWVAADPGHAGKGLGASVSAAVTRRFMAAGYRHIHLYTEDWRLPALKTYLKLGYVPWLYAPDQEQRWRVICQQIAWPFTPEIWKANGGSRTTREPGT